MKLTIRQKAFADYYIELGNAEQAAIKAGYSEKYARGNAHKLVANSCIKKYIDEKLEEMQSERIADAEEVLEYLTRVIRNEEDEEVVVTVNVGDFQTEVKKVKKELSAKDKIKAAELLGKRYRLFTDKVELESNEMITIIDDIGSLEDE